MEKDNIMKPAEQPKKKKKVWLIVLLCILGLLLAAVLTVYGIFHSKYSQIYEPETTPAATPAATNGTPATEPDYEEIVDASEEDEKDMEEATQDLEEKESVEATQEVIWDDDVYNILLLGTDERSKDGSYKSAARSDVCMLMSINLSGDHPVVSLVSFERGMGVPILEGKYKGQWDWLTHTFRYGGASLITREIRECFKLDVDHYVRVNFQMFKDAIDAIGGVEVDIDSAEAKYLRSAGFNHIKKGDKQLLNGNEALCYARIRKIDSDWVRIRRQREVVQSAMERVGKLPLDEMLKLVDKILPMVKTNIPEDKMAELILLLPRLKDAEFQQMTIPKKGTYGSKKGMGGRSMYSADFDANAQILQELLYPHLQETVPAE